jgi:acyl-CoA synthetase (AMP-forming)/AMP-acid ligase II
LTHILADILRGVPADDDAWCHAAPITHASGLFVLPHFVFGTRQIILPSWEADGLIEAVQARGATGVVLVPTMLARLLQHPLTEPQAFSSLRRLAYAGAPMPPSQIREVYERITPNLIQFYGLVEAIPPVTVLDSIDHVQGQHTFPDLLTSAGRPCLGVELQVVDPEGVPLPPEEIGEIVTRGDHVMRGYFAGTGSDPSAATTKAVVDGWLHTGDLGRTDPDGYLYLVDRKGDMIISGGYNIFPREIEDVIAELPGIDEVAVIGVSDREWGQRVVAYYRSASDSPLTPDQILAHCTNRLASFKKPKNIYRVDAFPLSSTGKIAKTQLREELERSDQTR